MLWDNKVTLLVETTTHCNAKCPQCSRTNPDGLGFSGITSLNHTTIEDWIATYARSYDSIRSFHFSGQWGDAFMNPDVEKIFRHIIDNSNCRISFSTNGSMRDEEFWWHIGAYCRDRISGTFDVDGITQENHEMYRRNTNLEKVMQNATAYAESGASLKIFSVVFKHNQGEMDAVKEWAESIGSKHDALQSNRFYWGNTYEYTYQGKQYVLEQTTDPRFLEKFESDRAIRDHRHHEEFTQDINCRWSEQQKLFVDQDQNVWPCCYWHSRAHRGLKRETELFETFQSELKTTNKYNLRDYTIAEILNKDFYRKDLEDSFEDNPAPICQFICSTLKSQDESPLEY